MTTIVIGPDTIASAGQMNSNQPSNTYGKFMNYMALGASAAGPVVEQSLLASGNESAAAIAGVTANATYGSSLAAAGGGGSASYLQPGSMGTSFSGSYLTPGGGSMYGVDGGSTTGVDGNLSGGVQDILSQTASSQAYLIGIQAQLGQQQSTFTAVSNALNVKHSMEKSAIQNFRV